MTEHQCQDICAMQRWSTCLKSGLSGITTPAPWAMEQILSVSLAVKGCITSTCTMNQVISAVQY
jgi:hypothetical protein